MSAGKKEEEKRIIFILGFMASGKSTVSRLLAQKLGYSFIDTDSIIEKEEGRPIHRIFEEEGEAFFRRREEKLLRRIVNGSDSERAVVATGGGMPCTEGNFSLMKEHGITVYLKSSPGDITARIKNTGERPLFHRLAADRSPKEAVQSLLKSREAFYGRADIHVWNPNSRPPAGAVREIVGRLSGFERGPARTL